jgi:H+/Cl- antiporter ClcA
MEYRRALQKRWEILAAGAAAAMAVTEIVPIGTPFYARETMASRILGGVPLLFSAIGLVAAVTAIFVGRRSTLAHWSVESHPLQAI